MISIFSDENGTRHYQVPPALISVAVELFGRDETSAIFQLCRRLRADDLGTAEAIAVNLGVEEAVLFSRRHLVPPQFSAEIVH